MFEYDCLAANEPVIAISAAAGNFLNRLPLPVMAWREDVYCPLKIFVDGKGELRGKYMWGWKMCHEIEISLVVGAEVLQKVPRR